MADKIVIHMRLGGATRQRIEQVRSLCALESNNEAVRYLIARGLEACGGKVNGKRFEAPNSGGKEGGLPFE